MKKIIIAVALFVTIGLTSCTDAELAKMGGYGGSFKIELLNADGTTAREWISSGKVLSEEGSDGYYFNEKSTGILTEVRGTLVITQIR